MTLTTALRRPKLLALTTIALGVAALPSGAQITTRPTSAAPTTTAPLPALTTRSSTLVVYSGRNERLVKPILDEFTEQTGIKLEVRYADSSALAATLLEEGSRTKADVFFSQDAGALGVLAKRGRLATLPTSITSKVDKRWRADNSTWIAVSGRARVFAYDPRQVATPPGTVAALLDPKYRGKIGYAPTNASWHSFVTGFRVAEGEPAARQWLTAFKANAPRSYASNGAVLQAVNRGEIAIGLVNHYYLYELIAAEGADRVVARNEFPDAGDPGALVNVAGVGVTKEAANDRAAFELVEFLLSKNAQEYFARTTREYPMISRVSASRDLPPLSTLRSPVPDLSDLDTLDETLRLLRDVGLL